MTDTCKKTALVTGAGKRVGLAIALGLARAGYTLALHYNSSSEGAELAAEEIRQAGGTARTFRFDLSNPAGAGDLFARVGATLGPVHVLVNSASLFDEDNLATMTMDSWRLLIDVNLTAPVFLMKAFAMQDPAPTEGAIVNMLDTQMTAALPDRFSYFCGKFGLEGATKLAAMDLAPRKIRVNAVAPGLVLPSGQTREDYERRQDATPLGRGLGPEHIVEAVVYLAGAKQVTGHVLVVDSGQRLMGMGNTDLARIPVTCGRDDSSSN